MQLPCLLRLLPESDALLLLILLLLSLSLALLSPSDAGLEPCPIHLLRLKGATRASVHPSRVRSERVWR
jgi:hypothetical protein